MLTHPLFLKRNFVSLKLVSLSSGSKGNATLIMSNNTAVLLDAGISYTRINNELRAFGLSVKDLDGVVISHEHADHIAGLQRVSEESKVFAHPLTMRAICQKYSVKNAMDVDCYEGGFSIGDIEVLPFRIPHDAAYPLAYTFAGDGARVSVATDMGVATIGMLDNVIDSQIVLLESNYDLKMLKEGKYPYHLKERILSSRGHLCNENAAKVAQLLCEHSPQKEAVLTRPFGERAEEQVHGSSTRLAQILARGSEVRHLVLGHISENNNTEQLAYDFVSNSLVECNPQFELHLAHQHRRSEVFETE